MTDPTHPIAVGVAVAAHVSGTWTWSVHTDTTRWRGTHADAGQVSDLAPYILDQIHDRFGEQVCVVGPPELGLALPTGREETLRWAAEHASRAARDLTTGHLRTLAIRRLPAEHHLLPGQEWTVSVHAVVDDEGSDWAWVTGAGWYATGRSSSPDLTQVAFEAIDAAATVSPLGGRVSVECDEPVAVKRAQALVEAMRQAQHSATTGIVPNQVDITHVETGSTPRHQAAVDLCAQAPDLAPVSDRPGELRPYQQRGVDALVRVWESSDRGQLRWACGAGKTVAYAESAQRVGAKRMLVLVPSLDLVAQIAQTWISRWGDRLRQVVAVCGDDETLATDTIEEAAARHRIHTLVVTDPSALTALVDLLAPTLVVATYQSLQVVTDAHAQHGLSAWDTLYLDEAHHTAGAVTNAWTSAHDVPAHRRCYGTATPRRVVSSDGSPVASMDDEDLFGPTADTYTVGEAIDDGYLAEYQLVGALVHADQVAEAIGARGTVTLDGVSVPAGVVAAQIAVLRSIRLHDLRSIICYAPTLAWARAFTDTLGVTTDLLGSQGPEHVITAVHINKHSPAEQRRTAHAALSAPGRGISVVVVVGCFGEGVDIPAVDAVALMAPNRSRTQLIQRIGRALRTGGKKNKVARIIAPIYVPPGTDPEQLLDTPAYAAFARVVHGLRSVDARFAHALTTATHTVTTLGAPASTPVASRWLRVVAAHPVAPAVDFAQSITTIVFSDGASRWWRSYRLAEQWFNEHGHLDVDPCVPNANGASLRRWLGEQAQLFRHDLLAPRYYDALCRIGMQWDSRGMGPLWPRLQAAVSQWHGEHENLLPPVGHPLYKMLKRARTKKNAGELTAEQIAWLDEHDMLWDLYHARRTSMIHRLGHFIDTHDRLPFFEEKHAYRMLALLRAGHRKQQLDQEQTQLCHQLRIPLSEDDPHAQPPPLHGPRQITLTGSTGEHLAAAIGAGATKDELQQLSGRTSASIEYQLAHAGFDSFLTLRNQAVINHVRRGHDWTDIARTFRVPVLTVGAILAKAETDPQPEGPPPVPTDPGQEWVTPVQAARMLDMPLSELSAWAAAGHLHSTTTASKRVRYQSRSVTDFATLLQGCYTLAQTSALLGVRPKTVHQLVKKGRLRRLRAGRQANRYLKADVDARRARTSVQDPTAERGTTTP